VHRNFLREHVTVDDSPRLHRAYERTRLANRTLFLEMSAALDALDRAGIPVILLKGAALVTEYYRDLGARYMGDVDVLIRPEQVSAAFRALGAAGLKPIGQARERGLPVYAERVLASASGRQLDLHWHLHHECLQPEIAERVWADATPIAFQGRRVLALHPAHALFHVIVHGAKSFDPSPRWVCDALAILDRDGAQFDWDRLMSLAVDTRLVQPLQEALPFLKSRFLVPVPQAVIDRCASLSVSTTERLTAWMERLAWPRFPRRFVRPTLLYLRWTQGRSRLRTGLDLPRFLYFWLQGRTA
jgi:hypothetical protein